ncbi:MAG TPA: hypothetical protein DFS52_08925 [Myxococcales bacterium]|nr:hypothetical protein [Myxococcales bacterium]
MLLASIALPLVLLAATPGASVEVPSGIKVETGSAGKASGASAGAPQARDADPVQSALPIVQVTVFSDRARVERRGELKLGKGEQRLRLPSLPASLDPDSVRLEARGAAVRSVEVRRARRGELPKDEAKRLLRDLETASDEGRALLDRKRVLDEQLALLQGLRPRSTPLPSPEGLPRLLEPAGWAAAASFFDTLAAATAAEIVALEAKLREHAKRMRGLQLQAAELLRAGAGEPGYLVEAVVEPRGPSARFELVYLVKGARWLPAYDVRYAPGSPEVEVHFAGLVSQASGEDWVDAKLVLSTAVPATKADLPKLAAWKIGDRDQFLPKPQPKPRPGPARPAPPVARQSAEDAASGDEELRRALSQAAHAASEPAPVFENLMGDADAAEESLEMPSQPARAERPPPSPPPAAWSRRTDYGFDSVEAETARVTVESAAFGQREASRAASVAPVTLGAPRGWSAPILGADLPASLAGGYDYTFSSARPESVRSGGEERRVALHSVRLPAKVLVTATPGLGKEAYLVADVTNGSDRPLLRGQANLYVGSDLQGQAMLKTTAVGEQISLPLGVDEAIGIERNVNLLAGEKGVFSKDDVTRYEVVVELLNPRAAAMEARVIDQIPLAGNQHVKVELERMEPWAIHDRAEGTLEWRVQLAPREKRVLRFVFTITRPRGARLQQW